MAPNFMLVFSFTFVEFIVSLEGHIVVEEHPLPLLVPPGENVTFSCKAFCDAQCEGEWLINDEAHSQEISVFEQRGFVFSTHVESGGTYDIKMSVSVNSSVMLNGTTFCCRFMHTSGTPSNTYTNCRPTLLIIENLPLSTNPMVSFTNTTNLTLSWSPPFLWPGHRINYYDILFINQNGDVITQRHGGNYTREVESLTMNFHNQSEAWICSEMTICISAITVDPQLSSPLQVCQSAVRRTPLSAQLKLNPSSVNTRVLFDVKGLPLLYTTIQMPHMVSCNPSGIVNYTLTVVNEGGLVVSRLGPKPHHGSNTIKDILSHNLNRNQIYSLNVRIDSLWGSSEVSTNISFSTSSFLTENALRDSACDALTYQIGMGLCLGIVVMLLSAFIFTLVIVCVNHSKSMKEKRCVEAKDRVCRAMVLNPIYSGDGPVYDSIQPSLNPDPHIEAKLMDSSNVHYELLHNPDDHNTSSSTARYIGGPLLPSQSNPLLLSTGHDSDSETRNSSHLVRCSSLSLPATSTTKIVALKPNGLPRNKLNLTLNLTEPHSHELPSAVEGAGSCLSEDDTYAVMRPVGSLHQQQVNGKKKSITGNNIL